MTSLKNKITFITGASSGIGKACAEYFAKAGSNLIISARRLDRIETLANELEKQYSVKVLTYAMDVRDNNKVKEIIGGLPAEWKSIDVLINNAGLALSTDKIQDGDSNNWDTMIDTNIKGLLYVTRAIIPGMIERQSGHIINIGSTAGHDYYIGGNVYSATKHAVKAINQSLRLDLLGKNIRVTEISPGLTHTEFSEVRWDDKEKSDEFYAQYEPLQAEDIADAAVYVATAPKHVNVAEMIIMPTCQASVSHIATE